MDGRSAETIAVNCDVSISTVRSQIKSILQKLGVNSQLAAVALAQEAEWNGDRTGESGEYCFSSPGRCWRFISKPDGTGRPDFFPEPVGWAGTTQTQGWPANLCVVVRWSPRGSREAGPNWGGAVITLGEWQLVVDVPDDLGESEADALSRGCPDLIG